MSAEGAIAVVEDDADLRGVLVDFLSLRGYEVQAAATGREGAALVCRLRPRLVILDLQLPDLDGLSVCRMLKADRRTRSIPILILTTNASAEHRLKALEYAADHFVAKPVTDLDEFHRWVRALAARAAPAAAGRREIGGALTLDDEEASASFRGASPVSLPRTLYALLAELAARPGEVLRREYLVDRVWNNAVRDQEVEVAVSRLRRRLGAAGAAVVSVPGQGYRLDITALPR